MRVVIQRVKRSSVTIDGEMVASIGAGLMILVGIEPADTSADADYLCGKIARLRIFDDENGVMNRSVIDVGGELLVVSQFTLFAQTSHGNRPSYIRAARPEQAIPLYEEFVAKLETASGIKPQTGRFGAMMDVELINDGPVTIIIDSRQKEF
ncbi:MAG: D-tyrosyl-tRNA(Tyr) deacylase [Salinivirgaceae bacterium]|nr:D-tyrosyl-tRNA(Tyr) deacylase [Salinivirgaceae bacterium]